MRQTIAALALMLFLMASVGAPVEGAPTEEQRQELRVLKTEIRKTANFLKRGMVVESVALVRDIQARIEKLGSADAQEIMPELEQLVDALAASHALLEIEGYTLKPLPGYSAASTASMPAPAMPANPATPTPSATPTGLPQTFPASNLSFTRHVAPILIARCGNCHVTGTRGGFSASTYEVLMKGPAEGVVIFPNDDVGSRLIETIESGDMPRGGGKVRPEELTALKTWIKEGAKFDGPNPKAALSQVAPGAQVAEVPRLQVMEASGNEKVSFSLDVAGVLANRCVSCHSGQNDAGNLSMESFAQFLRGGDSGPPFTPGKPDESMLVRLLKAPEGDRMPRNGPALTPEEISKIEAWIREGGKFDGDSAADSSMQRLNLVAKARIASHEDLAQMRQESSARKWQLGMPNITSAKVENDTFLAYGTMGEAALNEHVSTAEKAAEKVRSILKIPTGTPLVKGKMTLYFFQQRYDYAEFGNMVERREIPGNWNGHWWFDVTDAYGATQIPTNDEFALDVLLAQEIASAHMASLGGGTVPRWFAEGVGRVVASRMGNKEPRVKAWDDQIPSSLATMSKPDDFINNRLSPENNGVVSYAFAKAVMGRGGAFDAMLNNLRKGTPFDQAFSAAFGASPEQLAGAWTGAGK